MSKYIKKITRARSGEQDDGLFGYHVNDFAIKPILTLNLYSVSRGTPLNHKNNINIRYYLKSSMKFILHHCQVLGIYKLYHISTVHIYFYQTLQA